MSQDLSATVNLKHAQTEQCCEISWNFLILFHFVFNSQVIILVHKRPIMFILIHKKTPNSSMQSIVVGTTH